MHFLLRTTTTCTSALCLTVATACNDGDDRHGRSNRATLDISASNQLGNPLRVAFDIQVDPSAPVSLECVSETEETERHRISVEAEAPQPTVLAGLLLDHSYLCTANAHALQWQGRIVTAAGPDDLPEILLTEQTDPPQAQYTLFSHWRNDDSERGDRAIIVDGDGRIRWFEDLPDATSAGTETRWTGEQFLFGGGRGVAPVLMTADGAVQYRSGPPATGDVEDDFHHDVLTVDGLVVKLTTAQVLLGDVADSGFAIEAEDVETGEIVWHWTAQQGIDADTLAPTPEELHANAIQWLDDAFGPAVWVSLRGSNQLMRIDRDTESITHRLGVGGDFALVDVAGEALPDSDWFYGQHAPRFDGGTLLIYDNGTERPDTVEHTRVAEYTVDLVGGVVTKQWHWEQEGWFEPYFGEAESLEGGHVLVASGHCRTCETESLDAFLAEIDPSTDSVVWRLDMATSADGLYRADRIDPCALFHNVGFCPELDGVR